MGPDPKEGAPSPAIANARTELAYVRHAKGPIYQSHLLTYLGVRQVDAVVTPQQDAVGARAGDRRGAWRPDQQPAAGADPARRAARWSGRSCSPGHLPGQERLAELFLKNTPEKNQADPRLAPAQAIVDAAMKTARDRGESARMVGTIGESTRQLVADRIKAGGSLDGEIGRATPAQAPAPRDKDRSR